MYSPKNKTVLKNERLEHLIDDAKRCIHKYTSNASKPAILCSFGKDSLVLLHLVRAMGLDLPIISHRLPFRPEKYAHADRIIEEWGLDVYDYKPSRFSVIAGNGKVDVASHFKLPHGGEYLLPYANLIEPTNQEEFLCGVDALLNRETSAATAHDWDLLLAARKSSDTDPVVGDLGLIDEHYWLSETTCLAFPLRQWTDDDIWAYVELVELPVNRQRYVKTEIGWTEKSDKTGNPDYLPCCTRCFNPNNSASGWVNCPKVGMLVRSIAEEVPIREVRTDEDIIEPPLLL